MKSRAIATMIVASFFLTGCAAGGNAPTRLIKQVTDGVEKDIGDLKIRNVKIIALPDGSGTLSALLSITAMR